MVQYEVQASIPIAGQQRHRTAQVILDLRVEMLGMAWPKHPGVCSKPYTVHLLPIAEHRYDTALSTQAGTSSNFLVKKR